MQDEKDAAQVQGQRRSESAIRPRRKARMTAIVAAGALATALLLALVALLAGGSGLFGARIDPEKVQVDASVFKEYFTVERKLAANGGRTLVLTLKRTRSFPAKDADFEALAERTAKSFPALRALQAIGEGYVRCEFFGKKNEFLGFTFERIRGLEAVETTELSLPVSHWRGLERVGITY